MIPPVAARLPDGRRLHLQHGPIDLVIEATGHREVVAAAETAAIARFETILAELVPQLPTLRAPVAATTAVEGSVAGRMLAAARRFRGTFLTPMVAVAGSVADEICATMAAVDGIQRVYVNDGGDVAFHLTEGQTLRVGLVPSLETGRAAHVLEVAATDPVRGTATSGWSGRSFSFGIAESVTAVAADAAVADVAATLIANAVDLPAHPAVERRPARDLDLDSDLGDRLVTVRVGELLPAEVDEALGRGAEVAERYLAEVPELHGAVLGLRGRYRIVGAPAAAPIVPSADRQELVDAR